MKVQPHQYSYPDAIYRVLPFFYVSAGLLTMLLIRNWLAVVSGLILVSAGGIVWSMRIRYRRSLVPSKAPTPIGPSAGRLLEIVWKDSFKCGNPVIDAQHQKLFVICNELVNALVSYQPKINIDKRMIALLADISDHFCTEETLMAQAHYPDAVGHQEHHVALLSKTKKLRDMYLSDEVGAGELLGFIAYDVIVNHILREDIKWATPTEH